jgi:hypothetical protein
MDNPILWKIALEAESAIVTHYQPVFDKYIAENGLEGWMVGLLLAAITFEPEATTSSHLQVRGPYNACEVYLTRLATAAEKGYMSEKSPGEYRLTVLGRSEVEGLIDETRSQMARVDPLPVKESQQLVSLLDSLVQSSLNTPPPPDTWSIQLSAKLLPESTLSLPYIEQAISCLNAYRDDAHLAAWQTTGISAIALETLTLIWRGEVNSLDGLCYKLDRRGHPCHVFSLALENLREYRYIGGSDDAVHITILGHTFRDRVEDDTNRFFYKPWVYISDAEKVEIADLLSHLRDGLRALLK